jgi:hypothetical protein
MCFVFGKLNLLIRYGAAKIVWIRGEYGGVMELLNGLILKFSKFEKPFLQVFFKTEIIDGRGNRNLMTN